jgi:hypothetical protein
MNIPSTKDPISFSLSLSLSQLYLFFSLFRVLRSQKQLQEFGVKGGLVGLGTGPERLNTLTVWNDLLPLKRKNKKGDYFKKKESKKSKKKAVLPLPFHSPSVPFPFQFHSPSNSIQLLFSFIFFFFFLLFFSPSLFRSRPESIRPKKRKPTNNQNNNLLETNSPSFTRQLETPERDKSPRYDR